MLLTFKIGSLSRILYNVGLFYSSLLLFVVHTTFRGLRRFLVGLSCNDHHCNIHLEGLPSEKYKIAKCLGEPVIVVTMLNSLKK